MEEQRKHVRAQLLVNLRFLAESDLSNRIRQDNDEQLEFLGTIEDLELFGFVEEEMPGVITQGTVNDSEVASLVQLDRAISQIFADLKKGGAEQDAVAWTEHSGFPQLQASARTALELIESNA